MPPQIVIREWSQVFLGHVGAAILGTKARRELAGDGGLTVEEEVLALDSGVGDGVGREETLGVAVTRVSDVQGL
jgi:hypothetical protein